jgi:hypothetical protein
MTTAEIAKAYAERGWFVLPCYPQQKVPFFPIAKNGYKSASNKPKTVAKWFEKSPLLNIGIACAPSGIVVLDVDYRNGGNIEGLNLDTFTVATGDGIHLYYRAPKGSTFPGKLRDGVDIKFNGYVVTAGSMHENGKFYEIIKDADLAELSL